MTEASTNLELEPARARALKEYRLALEDVYLERAEDPGDDGSVEAVVMGQMGMRARRGVIKHGNMWSKYGQYMEYIWIICG